MHLDLKLLLRGNTVEATTTGVTLDVNDTETITCTLTYALEGGKCAGVDIGLEILSLLAQALFVLTCL